MRKKMDVGSNFYLLYLCALESLYLCVVFIRNIYEIMLKDLELEWHESQWLANSERSMR